MAEPRGPFNSPGFWLHHAALTWRRELDSRLVEIGLTHTQFNLLASANWLSRNGEQPTQQQTADLAGADRMMASKVLATLERHDLLERSPHPADPRAKRLRVTAAGATLVRRAVGIVADIDEEIFGPPSPQRDQLRDQLSGFTTSPNDQGKMDTK